MYLNEHCGTHSKSTKMNRLITNRNLIIVNFTIVSFFILIWLINFYKIDFVIIGVFKEIFTIPFLIAQIVFLVIGVKYLIKNQRNFLIIISVLSLAICSIFTIGSFFWNRIWASLWNRTMCGIYSNGFQKVYGIEKYLTLLKRTKRNVRLTKNVRKKTTKWQHRI